ncbi:MEIOTIC F-BOX protein MOF-like [Oryza sativa Japonica Group]|nr:uncharacterized protein LOC4344879 [Oryza sativa Japonica Group]USI00588.1 F-box domain-containing protein [Oryza sativa Japonica Group]
MSLEETNPAVVEEEEGKPGSAEEDAVAYGEVQVFDEMPLNETDPPAAAEEEGEPGIAEEDAVASGEDRLSEMPDMVLHHVMSFLKAWEAARTCVLSRRWRHLWASAPCVDILLTSDRQPPPMNRRMRHHRASAPCPCADVLWTRDRNAPSDTRRFVNRLLLARDELAPVDTLRLRSAHVDGFGDKFKNVDVEKWISEAIKRKARVIQLEDHYGMFVVFAHQVFASNHLKILKLSYAELDDDVFRGFSSRCPSLEELELKKCVVSAREISSVTLKSLIMVECKFTMNLSVGAPNLVFLQCITPMKWVPVLKDSGSLVTGSIMIDDSLLIGDSKKGHEVDGFSSDYSYGGSSEDYFDDLSSDISDDYDYNYENDINSDADTYEYNEIVNEYKFEQYKDHDDGGDCSMGGKYHGSSSNNGFNDDKTLGGQNVLHSLSNARSLELLAHSGEVVLSRESRSCPTFSNLKTLSLGEWCISMVADFDILILFLQNSPNLEKLFLQLEMSYNIQKELEKGIKPKGGSFACKRLSTVKIRCTKDDLRVHMLAQLFNSNGLSLEKIFVRRSGSFRLRNSKLNRELNCPWRMS